MNYINSELLLSAAEHEANKGEFTGMLATYDKETRNGHAYLSGAFDESLARQSSYPMLFNHDTDQVLGRIDLKPVASGVHARGVFNMKSPRAAEINDLIAMGAVTKMSISAFIQEYTLTNPEDPWNSIRLVSKADIAEGSIVVIPANVDAEIFEKSAAQDATDALRREILHQQINKTLKKGTK